MRNPFIHYMALLWFAYNYELKQNALGISRDMF